MKSPIKSTLDKDGNLESIEMIVDMRVVGKERPRVTKSGHTFTPKRTADFERAVQDFIYRHYHTGMLFHNFMKAELIVCFKGEKHCDNDNAQKSIFDAPQGLFYVDDNKILKIYSEQFLNVGFDKFYVKFSRHTQTSPPDFMYDEYL